MINTVYVNRHYIAFLQNMGESEKHKHDTCHLTISLSGKMHCMIEGKEIECYGYILNSNVEHHRFGENADSLKLIFVFDPCLSVTLSLNGNILEDADFVELTENQYERIAQISTQKFGEFGEKQDGDIENTIEEILKICGISSTNKLEMDARIEKVVEDLFVTETLDNGLADRLSESVGLSKSRFLHLFKESVGISFKKYIQNMKFFKTWKYIADGENITEACIHAGYSDSAHYANFMSQCYGMSTKRELSSIKGVFSLF